MDGIEVEERRFLSFADRPELRATVKYARGTFGLENDLCPADFSIRRNGFDGMSETECIIGSLAVETYAEWRNP